MYKVFISVNFMVTFWRLATILFVFCCKFLLLHENKCNFWNMLHHDHTCDTMCIAGMVDNIDFISLCEPGAEEIFGCSRMD